jgi:hypothetical protein
MVLQILEIIGISGFQNVTPSGQAEFEIARPGGS